ncbi:MAG: hypothetical protein ACP5RD_06115, partial [bacterium]
MKYFMKYMNKTKRGTILLFSIFLVLFIVSIIGIIYSYNKRIFQLAKQERDNYKFFKKQFDEMFTNIYMVDLIKRGYSGVEIEYLDVISFVHHEDFSFQYSATGTSSSSSINITPSFPNENTFQINIPLDPPQTPSFDISDAVNACKAKRAEYANKLSNTEAKNEIERKLKKLLGKNIKITSFKFEGNIEKIANGS